LENGNLKNANEIACPLNKLLLLVVWNLIIDHSKINEAVKLLKEVYLGSIMEMKIKQK
jgi:hypothetical protein